MCPKKVRLYKNNQTLCQCSCQHHWWYQSKCYFTPTQKCVQNWHQHHKNGHLHNTRHIYNWICSYKHNTCILNHVLGTWILSECNETHIELGLPTLNVMVMYATVPSASIKLRQNKPVFYLPVLCSPILQLCTVLNKVCEYRKVRLQSWLIYCK
jgi:hypothetical protein